MLSTSIDQTGLDSMIGAINNALIGTGGDASTVTVDESRLLAMQLMKLGQPRDRQALGKKIETTVRQRFSELNEDNATQDKGLGVSADGTRWYAYDKNFLYGLADSKDMRKADGNQIKDVFYHSVFKGGKARLVYDFKSAKKHQKIAITQRIITSKSSLARGIKQIKLSIGKLAASWFATAKTIDSTATAPAWIASHLTRGSQSSKSITDLTGTKNLDHPSVTFGSKAHAVASDKGKQQVQFAMNVRTKKLKHRLELILSGYAEDVRHGIKVARKAHKVKGNP